MKIKKFLEKEKKEWDSMLSSLLKIGGEDCGK